MLARRGAQDGPRRREEGVHPRDHAAATAGVECRKDEGVLDETPGAYKAIDDVMAAHGDLVDTAHTLSQVLCVEC